MSVKNLAEYKTPAGTTGNLLNPNDWLKLVLGSAVLLLTFGMGQKLASVVDNRLPGEQGIQPLQKAPVASGKRYV